MSDVAILHDRVREALAASAITDFEVLACEPHLADTAEFCAHYGISADEACNAILVALKTEPRRFVACLVRADTKLDVNRKVSARVGVKRLSFASSDETAELTGMMIGGVTIPGLPEGVPIYIDERVMERPRIIIGGGNRSSKIRIAPAELLKLPNASTADVAVPR
ncbi:MAG TPA: YbaK/EbsC family protein [Thermoanaerobaculia bacterium]|jgi:prolyl-tRNA editing enzyme YbaK/EbsC (Cys-tRNA(Pro) deacylase)|nr:YbaK/EbsC family protein [Thermoanaerobaculia bacterium]